MKKVLPNVTNGMDWVLNGEGVATVKYDGAACAIIDGELYKRYDAKKGKTPPEGAIPCCPPDPVTGHWPHWIKCDKECSSDKWFFAAFEASDDHSDGTYEAVGKHFRGNPYDYENDVLLKHGSDIIPNEAFTRSFEGIRDYLQNTYIEGIVFWKDGIPQCKIKRTDFGFEWNKPKSR
jgi:hypothetical protein